MRKPLTQDKVLAVLKGTGRGKRAPRYGNMDVYVKSDGTYLIQAGGVTLVDTTGDRAAALKDARERAERMRDLTGKAVVINEY